MNENVDGMMIRLVGLALAVLMSSASMASGVKLLLFHQLARAAATVRPLEMSCSSWALSMGSMGLPTALST